MVSSEDPVRWPISRISTPSAGYPRTSMSLRRAAYGPSALATQPSLQRAALSTSASRAGADGRQIWVSKPKEDRKSVFVGRAARLERGDEHEVRQPYKMDLPHEALTERPLFLDQVQEILAEVTLDKVSALSLPVCVIYTRTGSSILGIAL